MLIAIVTFVAFQAGWFACVLGGASGTSLPGVASVAALLAAQLAWRARTEPRLVRAEVLRIVAAVALGVAVDALLARLADLRFGPSGAAGSWPPPWMVALWPLFAAITDRCLGYLARRPLLAAGFGAVGGPLAYLGGERLGALVITGSPLRASLVIGAAWAIVTPLLMGLTERLGFLPGPHAAGVAEDVEVA